MSHHPFLLALVTVLAACRQATPEAGEDHPKHDGGRTVVELSPQQIETGQVRWQRLTPGGATPRLRLAATLVADTRKIAQVGARVAGRIASIDVQLGDQVKRGQVLVHVDTIEVHKVTLEYLTARANAQQKNDALERQRKLVTERVGAEADLRRAEAERTAAMAELKEAEEHLQYLGLSEKSIASLVGQAGGEASKSTVPSPIDGRVVALSAALGQVVVGTEDLATVADTRELWAVFRIYERDAALVALGAGAELTFGPHDASPLQVSIAFISDVVDPVSRTVEARAKLANPDGALRPGMTGTARVALRTNPDATCLPTEAVQTLAGRPTVFVRVGERTFEPRPIETLPEQGGIVCVRSGLRPEDEVVVHGAFAVRGEADRASLEE